MLNFRKGEVFLVDPPYSTSLAEARLKNSCNWCFKTNVTQDIQCSTCSGVVYCSTKCQEKDVTYHAFECIFLRSGKEGSTKLERFTLRTVARYLDDKSSNTPTTAYFFEHARTFDDLMSHYEEFEGERLEHMKQLSEKLSKLLSEHGHEVSTDLILRTAMKLAINAHGVKDFSELLESELGQAVYLAASKANHTCEIKTEYLELFEGNRFILKAMKDFSLSDSLDLGMHYVPMTATVRARREMLKKRYYFHCECKRCMKEELEPTNTSLTMMDFYLSKRLERRDLAALRSMERISVLLPIPKVLMNKLYTKLFMVEPIEDIERTHFLGYSAFETSFPGYHRMKLLCVLCLALTRYGANQASHEYYPKFVKYFEVMLEYFVEVHGKDHPVVMKILELSEPQPSRSLKPPSWFEQDKQFPAFLYESS